MSVLDNIFKYPKDYVFQKELYNSYLEEIKSSNTNNRTFSGYNYLDFDNMIIGGNPDLVSWKVNNSWTSYTTPFIARTPTYSDATYTNIPESFNRNSEVISSVSSGNDSIVYVTNKWFILAENSEDFTFYRGIESGENRSSFDFCGPNSNSYTNYMWFGTIIDTKTFKQAIGQDTTFSFYVKSSPGLNGQNLVCSIWKLADGTNWNLPESTTDPTHTFTTTFSVTSSNFTLVEINIPALSETLDWGDGVDPAIAIVFQLGNIPSSGTTSNLDVWETGYYTGYNNGSYYVTDWIGEVLRFRDFRLEIGNTRQSESWRDSETERLLCQKFFYLPSIQYSSQAYDDWHPFPTELYLVPYVTSFYYNRIILGMTDAIAQAVSRYPQLDAPFNTHTTGVDPGSIHTHATKNGIYGDYISTNATTRQRTARLAFHADYYFGSIT